MTKWKGDFSFVAGKTVLGLKIRRESWSKPESIHIQASRDVFCKMVTIEKSGSDKHKVERC